MQVENRVQVKRAVGQGAHVLKYDILSALLVLAAQGDAGEGRLALRLSLLITARYDWQRDRFNVGLREIARMWGVTERTAKRDMAQLRVLGWITVSKAAARGRVTEHKINMDVVLRATMPFWEQIGPDFVARLTKAPEPASSNIVSLHQGAAPAEDGSLWGRAAQRLHKVDPQTYQAWFARLHQVEREGDVLTVMAPSVFIANYIKTHFSMYLLAHVVAEDATVRRVQVIAH
ncbi:DnaA N-terminal domain-containing protein [Yoonia sp. MH D7]